MCISSVGSFLMWSGDSLKIIFQYLVCRKLALNRDYFLPLGVDIVAILAYWADI